MTGEGVAFFLTKGREETSRPLPKRGYVYILASKKNGTLYVGVTSSLVKRVWEHRRDLQEGFTKRYGVHNLVYCETHNSIREAIVREKRIKK